MTPVAIGDLARTLLLRHGMAQTRSDLAGLTAELAAGQAVDPGRHLRGSVTPLLSIDADMALSKAQQTAIAQAASHADAMQAALDRIDRTATGAAQSLMLAGNARNPEGLRSAAQMAMSGLEAVVAALNTRHGGAALFGGTATDAAPLAPAETILSAARTVIAGAQTPREAATRLQTWIAAPDGFATTAFRGTQEPVTTPIGPTETVRFDIVATDPAFRGALSGLILGALVTDPPFTDPDRGAELARLAGETVIADGDLRSAQSARLGVLQSRIEDASARTSGETHALGMARNDLLAVDLQATSSRILETEARLEMIYTLTSRLSRLSLTDYL